MKLSSIEPFVARPASESHNVDGSNSIRKLVVPKIQTHLETQPEAKDQGAPFYNSLIYLDFVRKMRERRNLPKLGPQGRALSLYKNAKEKIGPGDFLGTRINYLF